MRVHVRVSEVFKARLTIIVSTDSALHARIAGSTSVKTSVLTAVLIHRREFTDKQPNVDIRQAVPVDTQPHTTDRSAFAITVPMAWQPLNPCRQAYLSVRTTQQKKATNPAPIRTVCNLFTFFFPAPQRFKTAGTAVCVVQRHSRCPGNHCCR